ncbi:MAG: TonB-dependent receptor [Gammaproteobacteria bacterium]|nr:TonB-dependent receptor [Gammaproteobacteria bacterium]
MQMIPNPLLRSSRQGVLLACLAVATTLPVHAGARGGEEAILPVIEVTEIPVDAERDRVAGAKLSAAARDLPVSAQVLPADLLTLGAYADVQQAMLALSTATALPAEGGIGEGLMLRGFADAVYLRDGLNTSLGLAPLRSLANVERIEILNGPYGALYGPGEPGGTINVVTKRPRPVRAMTLAATAGSFGETAIELDATGPLAGNPALLYRLIAACRRAGSFRDFVDADTAFLSPSFAWQVSPRVRLDLLLEHQYEAQPYDAGVPAIAGGPAPPARRFLGEPSLGDVETRALSTQLDLDVELNDAFGVGLSFSHQRGRRKGAGAEYADLQSAASGPLLRRQLHQFNQSTQVLIAQLEAHGTATLAGMGNEAVLGIEATAANEDANSFLSDEDEDPYAIDPLRPVYGQPAPPLAPARLAGERTRQLSVYAQDLLALGDHWRVLAGGRWDHIGQRGADRAVAVRFRQDVDRFSPRIGVVYQPAATLAAFASFSGSIDPNEGLQPDGSPLLPTTARSLEFGTRWHTRDERLSIDAAAFVIRQRRVTTSAPDAPGFELQTAQQRSRGVDLDLRVQPNATVALIGRYAYLDAGITRDPLVPDGTAVPGVPRHQASLLGLFHRGGLRAGIAARFIASRPASREADELGIELPGYVRVDAFGAWQPSDRVTVTVHLSNLTGADYFEGAQSDALTLVPGAPLAVTARLRIGLW